MKKLPNIVLADTSSLSSSHTLYSLDHIQQHPKISLIFISSCLCSQLSFISSVLASCGTITMVAKNAYKNKAITTQWVNVNTLFLHFTTVRYT